MRKIIIRTSNPAKVKQIRGALSPLKDLVVLGVENKSDLPDVVEDGITASENARKSFDIRESFKIYSSFNG